MQGSWPGNVTAEKIKCGASITDTMTVGTGLSYAEVHDDYGDGDHKCEVPLPDQSVESAISIAGGNSGLRYTQNVVRSFPGAYASLGKEGDNYSGPAELLSDGRYLKLDQSRIFNKMVPQ